ncbi:branched-chain amino acid transport system ATP-binding protein [Variovorax paradoxus]|uniref:ABC transporter ATP-binding protein n=1 Tax=Variovorax paradoxus TaxID=34073 RepID=UPI0027884F0B|nr:ABC transporter ATP-binding protein [Variovorax paradoxus]MDQ0027622.1 branched-chain amino acid transport system ATP-binding protein [Variovorax paradoxus]
MDKLLEAKGLRAFYGPVTVLHGIDLDVEQGEVCALLGANGAGKTTTLRALCRTKVRTEGSLTLAGEAIERKTTEQVARLGVGHVPDGRGTFLGLTVEENLRLGCYTRADRAACAGDLERMYGYFPRLKERWRQQAGTLSGGEQQMLAISRALMARPRLLLLDEPSFGLAPLIVREIFGILAKINREERVSILLVEQNARLAFELAQRAYLLEGGRVVAHGSSEQMRQDDAVRRAYLGD